MVGLDLDGTLLNEKKELTAYTRKVLRAAGDAGAGVHVAIGRPRGGGRAAVWRVSGGGEGRGGGEGGNHGGRKGAGGGASAAVEARVAGLEGGAA